MPAPEPEVVHPKLGDSQAEVLPRNVDHGHKACSRLRACIMGEGVYQRAAVSSVQFHRSMRGFDYAGPCGHSPTASTHRF